MILVVYGDFSSPECYLASQRCDALAAAGVPVDFRVVEQRPRLPIGGLPFPPVDQDAVAERFHVLQDLLLPGEELPWTMPMFLPKTEAAISAYAAVADTPVAGDVRRLLFELYWREGLDIGNPNVLRTPLAGPALRSGSEADPLRQAGYAVNVDRGPITTDAYRRIQAWRGARQQLDSLALPALLVDGATLHGVDALRRLGKELTYAGADVAPQLPDARRYAPEPVQPSRSWVSQIGGRWRNTYRSDVSAQLALHT